jgi:hypothetical protein
MLTPDTRLLHYPPAKYRHTTPATRLPGRKRLTANPVTRFFQSVLSASGSACPMPRNTDLNGRIQATPKPT